MNKRSKSKNSTGGSEDPAANPEFLELKAVLGKIVERLEALEKKTDLVISQTSARFSGGREQSKPAPQPFVAPQPFRQPSLPPERPNEVKPAPVQPQGHGRARRERILHKAVCADCHKDCEIPFKPTGERPVYCKDCFSKRKAGNSMKSQNGNPSVPEIPQVPSPMNPPQRQVVVTKKGVGKVTVSEIVHHPAVESSPKRKSPPPSKKPRR